MLDPANHHVRTAEKPGGLLDTPRMHQSADARRRNGSATLFEKINARDVIVANIADPLEQLEVSLAVGAETEVRPNEDGFEIVLELVAKDEAKRLAGKLRPRERRELAIEVDADNRADIRAIPIPVECEQRGHASLIREKLRRGSGTGKHVRRVWREREDGELVSPLCRISRRMLKELLVAEMRSIKDADYANIAIRLQELLPIRHVRDKFIGTLGAFDRQRG